MHVIWVQHSLSGQNFLLSSFIITIVLHSNWNKQDIIATREYVSFLYYYFLSSHLRSVHRWCAVVFPHNFFLLSFFFLCCCCLYIFACSCGRLKAAYFYIFLSYVGREWRIISYVQISLASCTIRLILLVSIFVLCNAIASVSLYDMHAAYGVASRDSYGIWEWHNGLFNYTYRMRSMFVVLPFIHSLVGDRLVARRLVRVRCALIYRSIPI